MNTRNTLAFSGWRLSGINEGELLVDTEKSCPALPVKYLFNDVQLGYWSAITSAFEPDWA